MTYDEFRLVIDLGFATLPRLFTECPADALDAVVITHEHSDHCVDLNALFRSLHYGDNSHRRLPLYCPPEVVRRIDDLEPRAELTDVFDIHELPGTYDVGPFVLESVLLPHHVPNAGIRLRTSDTTIAYTGDCGPTDELVRLGAAADLFIMESTYDDQSEKSEPRYLSSAREAGEHASAAGARKLMLTHFWPGSDRARMVAEASQSFSGPVIAADEGLTLEFD